MTVKIIIKSLLIFFITCFTLQRSIAQNKHNEEVVIIGSTEPVINQSKKINIMPEEPVKPKVNTHFDFRPINKYFETPSKFSPIKPAKVRSYGLTDLYNNVLKIGFGSRLSPYAELFHSQIHKGKYKLDFHALHHSTFGKIKGYSKAPSSHSLAEIGFTKYFKKNTFRFNGGYQLVNTRNYFPFSEPDSLDYDSLKIAYNDFFFNTELIDNNPGHKGLNHKITLGGYYFFNKKQQEYYNHSNELNIQSDFDFHKSFKVTDLLDYQRLGGSGTLAFYRNEGITDYNNNRPPSSSINILTSLSPYFKAKYGIISFKAGINFSYLYYADKSHFRVFPDVFLNITLLPEHLALYAGADGDYEKNSYKLLALENPFISPIIPDSWKTDKVKIYGGFKGNIARLINFNINLSRSSFSDEYFYIALKDPNYSQYHNQFFILNDDGSLFSFQAQADYTVSKKADFFVTYEYHSYHLDSLKAPSEKLRSQLKAGGSYLVKNRYKPWLEVIYTGKRDALIYQTGSPYLVQTLKSYVDINLGMEYLYNENLSGFLRITNLLNKRYELFYQHPNYGIELMIGIGYKF